MIRKLMKKAFPMIVISLMLLSVFIIIANTGNASSINQVAYVPITITNSQGTATSVNFTQELTINWSTYSAYLNSNVSNVRFYGSAPFTSSNELYGWIENNNVSTAKSSNVWVNLGNLIIPASGSITIYMAFLPKTASWGSHWGLAPKLSTKYGEFDNGAKVFKYYWNFAGTTLPNNLSLKILNTDSGVTGNYKVNNSLLINNTDGSDVWKSTMDLTFLYLNASVTTTNLIWETRVNSLTPYSTSDGWVKAGLFIMNSLTTSSTSNGELYFAVTEGNGYQVAWQSGTSYVAPSSGTNGGSITYPTDIAIVSESTSDVGGFYGSSLGSLSQMGTFEAPTSMSSTGYVGLWITAHTTSGTSSAVFQYFLARVMPPSNVMPSVTFDPSQKSSNINFQETSLPSGAVWGIRLNNTTKVWWVNSSGQNISLGGLNNGIYIYQVINATGYYTTEYSGKITVNVSSSQYYNITIPFKEGYSVSLKEGGLISGIKWYANVTKQPGLSEAENGLKLATTSQYINFTDPNGSYTISFSDQNIPDFRPPSNMTITINGASINEQVIFVPITFNATFKESGLPVGTIWKVYVNGSIESKILETNATEITTSLINETYNYKVVSTNIKFIATISTISGNFTVSGKALEFNITFTTLRPVITLPSVVAYDSAVLISGSKSTPSANATITNYTWHLTGATVSTSYGENVIIYFNKTGTDTINLTITDSRGVINWTTASITVVSASVDSNIQISYTFSEQNNELIYYVTVNSKDNKTITEFLASVGNTYVNATLYKQEAYTYYYEVKINTLAYPYANYTIKFEAINSIDGYNYITTYNTFGAVNNGGWIEYAINNIFYIIVAILLISVAFGGIYIYYEKRSRYVKLRKSKGGKRR